MMCDKTMRRKANVWVTDEEGRGELQGDLKRLKEGLGCSEGTVEATTLGIENQVRLKAQL